ncbi:prepilin-type N-terminal cleavage/methylation domain-containing protein, partial [Patescibacteria group bacterium]|nr:prepilin-type N-terminal cleavage/methylation domain-containing protein [Patescibacteria group bacterium]
MLSKRKGFTLIELLVVMAILAILSTVAFGQYRISQLKARDAQRKGDIGNIARGLEMYYNDNQAYPLSDAAGRMSVSQSGSLTALDWGSEFATDEVIYMKVLPRDPTASGGNLNYCYQSDDGSYYKIFVKLENDQDKDFDLNRIPAVDYSCLGDAGYNYGISSVNVTV